MVSGNGKRNVKYGHIQVRIEIIPEFKTCIEGRETYTDTLRKLIKTFQESNKRKCPDCSDPGVHKTIVENA